jgi:hypothetical protein
MAGMPGPWFVQGNLEETRGNCRTVRAVLASPSVPIAGWVEGGRNLVLFSVFVRFTGREGFR